MKIRELFQNKVNKDVYVIAEVSQNHDGSLGQAHAFIDACAEAGADAVKFQTHIAEAESTPQEPFRVQFSYEDKTRYDYWKRMEFTREQWVGLKRHAQERGIEFLSSAFSVEAFELLEQIGMEAWKLGSGEVFNAYLLDRMLETGKPILISSGMSTFEDIRHQVERIEAGGSPYAIFQCTTSYPNPFESVGLNVIDELHDLYDCPIGLSDHSGTIYPALAAVARGASMIETHVTLSRYMFGPDVSSSVTIEQLREMIEGIRAITCMLSSPVNKCVLEDKYTELKSIFAKGIYAKRDILEGELIRMDMLSMKKPLNGMSAEQYQDVVGRKAGRNIEKGSPIRSADLE